MRGYGEEIARGKGGVEEGDRVGLYVCMICISAAFKIPMAFSCRYML